MLTTGSISHAASSMAEPRPPSRRAEAAPARAQQGAADAPRDPVDAALVAHIVEHHRAYSRSLQYIVPLLAKIASFHGRRNEKLSALREAGEELAERLEAHLEQEERELFPALMDGAPRREVVRRELAHMHRDHRVVALLLARIRSLADGYSAPEWAGQSYRVLMEELADLEEDVTEHMHLENYALIPRLLSRSGERR